MNSYIFYDQMQYLRVLRFKSGYNQNFMDLEGNIISFPLQRKQISVMDIYIHS